MELFLAAHPSFPSRRSLFMTADGNLELAREDDAGNRLDVEFER
jgi:hypothetical protein